MSMRLKYSLTLLLASVLFFLSGCTKDDDTLQRQQESIERYLESSHVPRLIWEEELETSLEPEPPFYEKLELDTYRYIATYYEPDRLTREEVISGSVVELRITGYIFQGGSPKIDDVFYSNDESIITQLVAKGLNTEFWSTEPLVLKMGSNKIIKGLEISLYGCREGDSVEAYSTMADGYGSDDMGIVPSDSPIIWIYTILSIKNE